MLDNSEASDTLEGIVQWWLLDRGIKQNLIEVRGALDELSERQLVLESRSADQKVHYRINQSKRNEIVALLSEPH